MPNLSPTVVAGPLAEYDAATFRGLLPPDIDGVVWDLDKTVVGQDDDWMPQEHINLLKGLADLNLVQGFGSNAKTAERTARVLNIAHRLSSVIGSEIIAVTSRMVDGKKKPLRPIFDLAALKLGIEPEHLCFVGDQLFKDIAGGNNAGYGATVLVPPFGKGDDPRVRYVQRPLETVVRPWVGAPLRTKNFGK